ncbi:unnamed protein product [Gordionus sp. m RMFG-2023]
MKDEFQEIKKLNKDKQKALIKGNDKDVAEICNYLGDIYSKLERYEDALEEHYQELKISQDFSDILGQAIAHRRIAECLCSLKKFSDSYIHVAQYLKMSQKAKSLIEQQRAHTTMGRIFMLEYEHLVATNDEFKIGIEKHIEFFNKKQDLLDKSENESVKALDYCYKLTNVQDKEKKQMLVRSYLNMGLVNELKKNYQKCATFLQQALKIAKLENFKVELQKIYFTLCDIYSRDEDTSQSLSHLDKALSLCQKLNDLDSELDGLNKKIEIMIRTEDFQRAKDVLKRCQKLTMEFKEKISTEESTRISRNLKLARKLCHKSNWLIKRENRIKEVMTSKMELSAPQKVLLSMARQFEEKMADYLCELDCSATALAHYQQALTMANRNAESKCGSLAPLYFSLSQTHSDIYDFDKALDYAFLELKCYGLSFPIKIDQNPLEFQETIEGLDEEIQIPDRSFQTKNVKLYRKKSKNPLESVETLKTPDIEIECSHIKSLAKNDGQDADMESAHFSEILQTMFKMTDYSLRAIKLALQDPQKLDIPSLRSGLIIRNSRIFRRLLQLTRRNLSYGESNQPMTKKQALKTLRRAAETRFQEWLDAISYGQKLGMMEEIEISSLCQNRSNSGKRRQQNYSASLMDDGEEVDDNLEESFEVLKQSGKRCQKNRENGDQSSSSSAPESSDSGDDQLTIEPCKSDETSVCYSSKGRSLNKESRISQKFVCKRNEKGETLLHTACIEGNFKKIKKLIQLGHPVNVRDNAGWTPLHEACNFGHSAIVSLLISEGATVNDTGPGSLNSDEFSGGCDGITPLHDALYSGNLETAKILLLEGVADPSIRDERGNTSYDALIEWRSGNEANLSRPDLEECTQMETLLANMMKKRGIKVPNRLPISANASKNYSGQQPNIMEDGKQRHFQKQLLNRRHNLYDLNSERGNEVGRTLDSNLKDVFDEKRNAVREYKQAITQLKKHQVKNNRNLKNDKPPKNDPLLIDASQVVSNWLVPDGHTSDNEGDTLNNECFDIDNSCKVRGKNVRPKSTESEEDIQNIYYDNQPTGKKSEKLRSNGRKKRRKAPFKLPNLDDASSSTSSNIIHSSETDIESSIEQIDIIVDKGNEKMVQEVNYDLHDLTDAKHSESEENESQNINFIHSKSGKQRNGSVEEQLICDIEAIERNKKRQKKINAATFIADSLPSREDIVRSPILSQTGLNKRHSGSYQKSQSPVISSTCHSSTPAHVIQEEIEEVRPLDGYSRNIMRVFVKMQAPHLDESITLMIPLSNQDGDKTFEWLGQEALRRFAALNSDDKKTRKMNKNDSAKIKLCTEDGALLFPSDRVSDVLNERETVLLRYSSWN